MANLPRDDDTINYRIDLKKFRDFEDTLKALLRMQVHAGIIDDKEASQYMSQQEFGHFWTPPNRKKPVWVPARPFFRLTLNKLREPISKNLGQGLARLFAERSQRPTFHSLEKILIKAGKRFKRGLKETIQQHEPIPDLNF